MFNKVCKRCEKPFTAQYARTSYCSEECRRGKSKCIQCGNEFLKTKGTTGKFCSSECWYEYYNKQNNKECPHCHEEFNPKTSKQKYCSVECSNLGRTKRSDNPCLTCGNPFDRTPATRKAKYCSRACALTGRSNKGNSKKPLGSIQKHSHGYNLIKVGNDYPGSYRNGWLTEHRYVMEQHLGRSLTKDEYVHHKNGVRDDNRIENLELWSEATHKTKKDPAGQRSFDKLMDQFKKLSHNDKLKFITKAQLLTEID